MKGKWKEKEREWDWEERVWGWGWCSDRDSHVEECLSCREQVVLGHSLSLSIWASLIYLACLTLLGSVLFLSL